MMKVIDTETLILSGKAVNHIIERHIKKAVRASQFYDNVDVSRLILNTITELERRKREENSRLYYPPKEEQTVPFVYILPKNGRVFKVRYINIGYSIGKSLGGCDTDQLEIIMVKTSGRWDIITAYPCS